MTYIVELTINYVLEQIEENKLSDQCLEIIRNDIKSTKDYRIYCNKQQWLKLLKRIKEVI